jgi:heptaprenylglyceryl phosphate synthase
MKIIISERQLRQIIESKEERNLLEIDVEYLLNNTSLVMKTLKKGVDGIVVGGDLYTIDLENDYVNDLLNNLVKVYGSLDIGGRIKPSSFDKLEEVTDWLYMIFNKDIKS